MSEHVCSDDDGVGGVAYVTSGPSWRFSTLDILGIALNTAANMTASVANGMTTVAQELMAAANYRRAALDQRDAERERRRAAQELEAQVGSL